MFFLHRKSLKNCRRYLNYFLIILIIGNIVGQNISYDKVPKERQVQTNIDWDYLVHISGSHINNPIISNWYGYEKGFIHNSNQEFIYVTGIDFEFFMHMNFNSVVLILSMDVPLLPVDTGIKEIQADNQNLKLKISHLDGYSRIDVILDKKYYRVPYWSPYAPSNRNPGNYPGYNSEKPFYFKTVKDILEKLVPNKSQFYLPLYYTITYASTRYSVPKIEDIQPDKDPSLQVRTFGSAVVPLVFEAKTGRKIRQGSWSNADYLQIASDNYPRNRTKGFVGGFGFNYVLDKTELMWWGGNFTSDYKNSTMIAEFKTPKKLPVNAGLMNFNTSTGGNVQLRIIHGTNTSQVYLMISKTHNRTPSWWQSCWNAIKDSKFTWNEQFLLFATINEVFEQLVSGDKNYYPLWYQVAYTNISSLQSIDPKIDLSYQSCLLQSIVSLPSFVDIEENKEKKDDILLQNYPNPFNPECYIPYELKDNGNVKVKIYNVLGQKVRELEIGQKAVGNYITKDKAAYWDGKDSKGKEVVSGIYYYELMVDEKAVGMKKSLVLK